jgi:hypothetical protein
LGSRNRLFSEQEFSGGEISEPLKIECEKKQEEFKNEKVF